MRTTRDTLDQTTALATTLAGDSVDLAAGNDLTVQGGVVSAAADLTATAGRDLILDTAEETSAETHFKAVKRSGFSFSRGAISYGNSVMTQ